MKDKTKSKSKSPSSDLKEKSTSKSKSPSSSAQFRPEQPFISTDIIKSSKVDKTVRKESSPKRRLTKGRLKSDTNNLNSSQSLDIHQMKSTDELENLTSQGLTNLQPKIFQSKSKLKKASLSIPFHLLNPFLLFRNNN
jgi:hypothetical protein